MVNSAIVLRHVLFEILKNSVDVLSQTESSFLAILPWNSRSARRKNVTEKPCSAFKAAQ